METDARSERAVYLKTLFDRDDVGSLRKLAEKDTLDFKGFFAETSSYPLEWAAAVGATQCLEELLRLSDQQPYAAAQGLVEAVRESHAECVRLLLNHGTAAEGLPDQYADDTDDDSPISAALHALHPDIVSMLCDAGGVARSEVGWLNMGLRMAFASRRKTKTSCLFMVAREVAKRIESETDFTLAPEVMKKLADWLKKEGKKVTDRKTNEHLEKVIRNRFSAEEGLKEEIIDFLTLAEHPMSRRDLGWMRVVLLEQPPEIRQRLASAALPYLVNVCGYQGWWDVVFEAVEKWKADINARSESAKTPLMWAFSTGKDVPLDVIQRLLSYEPDINAVDENGRTALTELCCRHEDRVDLYALLRLHGAKTFEELGLPYPRHLEKHLKEQFAKLPPLPREFCDS